MTCATRSTHCRPRAWAWLHAYPCPVSSPVRYEQYENRTTHTGYQTRQRGLCIPHGRVPSSGICKTSRMTRSPGCSTSAGGRSNAISRVPKPGFAQSMQGVTRMPSPHDGPPWTPQQTRVFCRVFQTSAASDCQRQIPECVASTSARLCGGVRHGDRLGHGGSGWRTWSAGTLQPYRATAGWYGLVLRTSLSMVGGSDGIGGALHSSGTGGEPYHRSQAPWARLLKRPDASSVTSGPGAPRPRRRCVLPILWSPTGWRVRCSRGERGRRGGHHGPETAESMFYLYLLLSGIVRRRRSVTPSPSGASGKAIHPHPRLGRRPQAPG
jgi:hypothetical protein